MYIKNISMQNLSHKYFPNHVYGNIYLVGHIYSAILLMYNIYIYIQEVKYTI